MVFFINLRINVNYFVFVMNFKNDICIEIGLFNSGFYCFLRIFGYLNFFYIYIYRKENFKFFVFIIWYYFYYVL